MARARIKASGLATALTVAGLAATLPVVAVLTLPQAGFAGAFNLTLVNEARANALVERAVSNDDARASATLETRRTLAEAPANSVAWSRLAYLDSLGSTGLTQEGERAIAASYAVAPYGPDVTPWRLRFVFNHWSRLSEGTRRAALDELRVVASVGSRRALSRSVSDPAGRLALGLTHGVMSQAESEARPAN